MKCGVPGLGRPVEYLSEFESDLRFEGGDAIVAYSRTNPETVPSNIAKFEVRFSQELDWLPIEFKQTALFSQKPDDTLLSYKLDDFRIVADGLKMPFKQLEYQIWPGEKPQRAVRETLKVQLAGKASSRQFREEAFFSYYGLAEPEFYRPYRFYMWTGLAFVGLLLVGLSFWKRRR